MVFSVTCWPDEISFMLKPWKYLSSSKARSSGGNSARLPSSARRLARQLKAWATSRARARDLDPVALEQGLEWAREKEVEGSATRDNFGDGEAIEGFLELGFEVVLLLRLA